MDPPQGEHFGDRSASDRQHSRHPHRRGHCGRFCHRLRRLCAVRFPCTGNSVHPVGDGGAGHAGRGAVARTGARRPRPRRRLRHAYPGFVAKARLLGAVYLSRNRHRSRLWAGADQAMALARRHHDRIRAALDFSLPTMRPDDGWTARVPCDDRVRARKLAGGVRVHVRPAGRARANRADLLRLARGLSVGRDHDRAREFSRRYRHYHVRRAGRRNIIRGLARVGCHRRNRRCGSTCLCRVRRMGGPRQSGHAGAAGWAAAGHRPCHNRQFGVVAFSHRRDLRGGLWRCWIFGAGPRGQRHRCHRMVGRGGVHAARAVDRALCPHRASRSLDPVCDPGGGPCSGLWRGDRNSR